MVNISTTQTVHGGGMGMMPFPNVPEDDPFYEFFRRFGQPGGQGPQQDYKTQSLGSGFIISPDGHVVAKVGKFLGDETNNVAEYMGLIIGLKRAKAMGIKELDVLADSELMVKQLNGDYAVKAEHLKPLHDEAKALLKAFTEIEIRHIPREENAQADAMSNRAIDLRL